jgi:endonuclease-3 related protein
MAVGAILTQNTAWPNVERAIARLRDERALDVRVLHDAPLATLAGWIRPAGTFRVKARRLRAFTTLLMEQFGGRLDRLLALDRDALRAVLLGVHGIGPETADCIVLYAAGKPSFVIDAYTRRVLHRHGWADHDAPYDRLAGLFTASIPRDARIYNEYHALLVRLGKEHCRARARCEGCPLQRLLPRDGPRT